MKVRIQRATLESVNQSLLWAQRALLVCAAVLLGYCAISLFDAWSFQKQHELNVGQLPIAELPVTLGLPAVKSLNSPDSQTTLLNYGLVGRLEIARLGLSVIVAEGISSKTLRRAVGHIPGTAEPGQDGNVGIAGHRDTFFRPLEGVLVNDIIVVATQTGEYNYRVLFTRVVSPDEVTVLDPTGAEVLTLVTCHPFYFVGPAPNRFIVRAERVLSAAADTAR